MEMLLNYVFIDIEEAFLLILTAFSLFNIPVRENWKSLLLWSALLAAWGDILSLIGVTYQMKLILFFCAQFLILLSLGHKLRAIPMTLISAIWLLTAEPILVITFNFFDVDFIIFSGSSLLRYALSYIYLATLSILPITLKWFRFDARTLWPKTVPNRYLLFLVISGGISVGFMLLLNISVLLIDILPTKIMTSTKSMWMYQLGALIFMLLNVLLFYLYVRETILRVERETEAPYAKQLIDLTTAVRSIKHDVLNHYTVILGYLKMNEYGRIENFVQNLVTETKELIDITEGVKNKTVSALLYGKMSQYTKDSIDFQVKVSPNAPQLENWKDIDVSKLLGNLLDNAYTATKKNQYEDRYIRIEWGVRSGYEYLFVENSGPTIPEEALPRLFDLGYTTRESGKGGVGLPVVKALVTKYKGEIDVVSRNGVTRFTVTLPIAEKGSQKTTDTNETVSA